MVEMAIFNIQRAITLKVGTQELQFMCSECHLMVFNICIKFHENMLSGFKVMELPQKLLTDTHTKDKPYTPLHCILRMPGDITRVTVHVFCMLSHGLTLEFSFMKICQAVLNLRSGHKNC